MWIVKEWHPFNHHHEGFIPSSPWRIYCTKPISLIVLDTCCPSRRQHSIFFLCGPCSSHLASSKNPSFEPRVLMGLLRSSVVQWVLSCPCCLSFTLVLGTTTPLWVPRPNHGAGWATKTLPTRNQWERQLKQLSCQMPGGGGVKKLSRSNVNELRVKKARRIV